MSTTVIIALIIVLLVALLAYAFVSQTIADKRQQRQRLLAALKQRAANFRQMIDSFPAGFLTKDLNILLHQCLLDATRQLSELEVKNQAHVENLALLSKQLEAIKRQPRISERPALQNPQQLKQARALLQDLHSFIGLQHQKGVLAAAQHKSHEREIRHLMVQIGVDSNLLNARQAEGRNKARLAAHYYSLAIKLLTKEDKSGNYQQQIADLRQQQQILLQSPSSSQQPGEAANKYDVSLQTASEEWQKFGADEAGGDWKKKSIYD